MTDQIVDMAEAVMPGPNISDTALGGNGVATELHQRILDAHTASTNQRSES